MDRWTRAIRPTALRPANDIREGAISGYILSINIIAFLYLLSMSKPRYGTGLVSDNNLDYVLVTE